MPIYYKALLEFERIKENYERLKKEKEKVERIEANVDALEMMGFAEMRGLIMRIDRNVRRILVLLEGDGK